MIIAFQPNAFQHNAFQIGVVSAAVAAPFNLAQLDRGIQFQSVLSYHGPTLGWVRSFVKPEKLITSTSLAAFQRGAFQGGTFQGAAFRSGMMPIALGSGDSVVLINIPGLIEVTLPDVQLWVLQPVYQPYDPIDRAIWIKDLGGNAAAFPITVTPFGSQTIDGQSSASIISNRGIMRLYPLYDFTGWFIDGP